MPLISIEQNDDPRVAVYRDLPKSRSRELSGRFVVEGRLLVERLAASPYELESLLVVDRRLDLLPADLPANLPIFTATGAAVDGIIGFDFHRGILACGRRRPYPRLQQLLPDAVRGSRVVVCAGIQDAVNLGGILRNAAAFGVDLVLLSRPSADPFSRRVLRVSMGTALTLPLVLTEDLKRDLLYLRDQQGMNLIAAVLDPQAEPLEASHRPRRCALLFGNEGYGLAADVVALCHRRVTIRMDRQTDSLNASVASGVCLYHFARAVDNADPSA